MSATLSYVALGVGLVLAALGWLWSAIVGFQRSAAWGFALLLFPLAGIGFLFVAWRDAKRPVLTHLAGVVLCASVVFWAFREKEMAFSKEQTQQSAKSVSPSADAQVHLSQRLAALKQKEQDLLARKAKLDLTDSAAAGELAREIHGYNLEVNAALAEQQALELRAAGPAATQ